MTEYSSSVEYEEIDEDNNETVSESSSYDALFVYNV